MTLIPLWVFLYSIVTGVTFRVIANGTHKPSRPWDTPGPLFGAIIWPLTLPTAIGIKGATLVLGDGTARAGRGERRRERELIEAKHRREVAKIEAEATRELERALDKA